MREAGIYFEAKGVVVETEQGQRILVYPEPYGFSVLNGPGVLADSPLDEALTSKEFKERIAIRVAEAQRDCDHWKRI